MIYADFVGRWDLIPRPPLNKLPELPMHQTDSINLSANKKKYINTLHIPHILGTSKENDVKLLKLVIPSISWCRISWNDFSHIEC